MSLRSHEHTQTRLLFAQPPHSHIAQPPPPSFSLPNLIGLEAIAPETVIGATGEYARDTVRLFVEEILVNLFERRGKVRRGWIQLYN